MSIRVVATRVFLMGGAVCLAAGIAARGQDMAGAAKAPSYDVVSIKLNKGDGGRMMIRMSAGYSAEGVPLKLLIESAYNLKTDDQVSGIPRLVDGARFDIEAKADVETIEALKKLTEGERGTQRRLMMRAMLEDRFKLKVHAETKELPIFALVIAKGGTKLKEADPNDAYANGVKGPDGVPRKGMMMMRNGTLTAQGIPVADLANNLGRQLGRQVVDRTGLTGKYDFTLTWSPDEGGPGAGGGGGVDAGASTAPSIFTALQEQLGLKLESTKGPVDTIVVDRVEMPSEN